MSSGMDARTQRAAIVLAGGEGTRLQSFTESVTGRAIPKQYCPISGTETMLQWTLRRVSLRIARRSILPVVAAAHAEFYESQLTDIDEQSLVVEPQNRGTASAILHGLLRLAKLIPDGTVAIFPSDHYVNDDCRFMRYVDLAFDYIQAFPQRVALLGIQPNAPEVDYGWVEPGRPAVLGGSVFHNLLRVRRFHEKPPLAMAEELFRRGCLWNSFVLIGNTRRLLALIAGALPDHYRSFSAVRAALASSLEVQAIEFLYRSLPAADFSYGVLQKVFSSMVVVPVAGLEWSDLGTPERLLAVLGRTGAAVRDVTVPNFQTRSEAPPSPTSLPGATESLFAASTQPIAVRQREFHPPRRVHLS
jgi:mannose-1-phosphate guanylyltransferase